ncbi:hypothetical protein KM295_03820 [Natronomonas sp. F2-12]|jgi:hypothetical protein|uniref:Uncharacterized protein n=1 Tax=Natronomonas aquatica TaxID=2841590 RepID=A0A9R1CRJ8_9EURY|nr:hypothetical protein [Natronomonas aquatica]MCQ4332630.1 hypothetical protein [Natronomonas aquatica]
MSVAGLCELCESESVEDGCDRCSRLVCAHHYDEPTGLCTLCLSELGDGDSGGSDRNDGREKGYPDGVDEYRF